MNTLLAFERLVSQYMVERLGWVLVHSLWQFALVALLASVIARAMRRNSAGIRYIVLVAAMAVSVAAPAATWLLLPSDVVASVANQAKNVAPESISTAAIDPESNVTRSASDAILASEGAIDLPVSDSAAASVAAKTQSPLSRDPAPIAETAPSWSERARTTLQPWLAWIVVSWSLGVVVCSARPMLGWYTLRRLRRVGTSAVPNEVLVAMQRVSKRLGLRRVVRVVQSSLTQVPIVVGYFRPVILLPVSLVTSIPVSQLEAILAHELAHVGRHDFVINLLQTLIETLFFYHPAVWWLSHRIRVEREHCCDDLVVTLLGNRVEYGRALVAIEQLRGRSSVLALGATDGSLLSRVRRIAGFNSDCGVWSIGSALCLAACSLAVIAALSMLLWHSLAQAPSKHSDNAMQWPFVAEFADGVSIELVGITQNTALANEGWRADGAPIGDVGDWKVNRVMQEGETHVTSEVHDARADTDARDLLLRFRGLKDRKPSIHFTLPSGATTEGQWMVTDDPFDLRYPIGRTQVFKVAKKPNGVLEKLVMQFDWKPSNEDPQLTIGISDEPWGRPVRIQPDGKIIDPIQPDEPYAKTYQLVEIVGAIAIDKEAGATWITIRQPPTKVDPADRWHAYDFEFYAVDTDGAHHTTGWRQEYPNGKYDISVGSYGLSQPLPENKTLSHYEYRLRPYRHWVTFANVSLSPGEMTDVKVMTSRPNAADEAAAERVAWDALAAIKVSVYGEAAHQQSLLNHLRQLEKGHFPEKGLQEIRQQLQQPIREADFWSVPAAAWPHVGRLLSLRQLSIVASDLRGKPMEEIGRLHHLRRLVVTNSKCQPQDLASLRRLTELEHLDVMFTVFDQTAAWRKEQVGELSVTEQELADRVTATHPNREHILQAAILTDRALETLGDHKRLRTVKLINTFVSSRGVQVLSTLPALEDLELGVVDESLDVVRLVGGMRSLKRLSGLSLTDETLAECAALTQLEELGQHAGGVTDQGVEQLLKIASLRKLVLWHSQLTDAGLERLAELPHLESLDVRFSKSLSKAGLERFQKRNPKCKVAFDSAAPSKPQHYVANLPDGLKVEFVGITKNTAPAKEGWRPNGLPLGEDVGYWPSTIVLRTQNNQNTTAAYTENGPHPEPDANAIDFLFRFRGLKTQPSFSFDLPANGGGRSNKPLTEPYEFRLSARRRGEPPPRAAKWSPPDGEMHIGLTDEPWGTWQQISATGEFLNQLGEGDLYRSSYALIQYQGVGPSLRDPKRTELVLLQPKQADRLYAFEIRGIDSDGQEQRVLEVSENMHGFPDFKGPEVWRWIVAQPLPEGKQLARFEYRLRPFRHWVTFKEVSLEPGKPSDVKVSVRSLPPEKPKAEKYVATLPSGAEVELAGLVFVNVSYDDGTKRRKDDAWWRADGTKLDAPPFKPYKHWYGEESAHFREVYFRLTPPRKDSPITVTKITSSPSPHRFVYNGGGWDRDDVDLSFMKFNYTAGFEDEKPVAIQVFISDQPFGPAWQIDLNGKTIPSKDVDATTQALRDLINIVRVEKTAITKKHPYQTLLRFELPPDHLQRMDFQLVAVTKQGESLSSYGRLSEAEGNAAGFTSPLDDLSHFEIILKPTTHKVTFENVSPVPGKATDVTVKVEPVELLAFNGLEFLKPYPKLHGLSLNMTEPQFLEIVKQQELPTRQTVDGEKTTHHIALGDGHTLIVVFDKDAKCSGIQRVQPETETLKAMAVDMSKLLPDHWRHPHIVGGRTIEMMPGMYTDSEHRPHVVLVFSDDKTRPAMKWERKDEQYEYLGETPHGHGHLFVSMKITGEAAKPANLIELFDWPEATEFVKAFLKGDHAKTTALKEIADNRDWSRNGWGPIKNGIRSHWVPYSTEFVVGRPLTVGLELYNFDPDPRTFDVRQAHPRRSWEVLGPDGKPVPLKASEPILTGVSYILILQTTSSLMLFGGTDLAKLFDLSKPGRYTLRFTDQAVREVPDNLKLIIPAEQSLPAAKDFVFELAREDQQPNNGEEAPAEPLQTIDTAPMAACRAIIKRLDEASDVKLASEARERLAKRWKWITEQPVASFLRELPKKDPNLEPVDGGELVGVQRELDGVWSDGKGTADDWKDWIVRKQDGYRVGRLQLLFEAAQGYRKVEDAASAKRVLQAGLSGYEIYDADLKTLIGKYWPVTNDEPAKSMGPGPEAWTLANYLGELSSAQQALGEIDQAIITHSRLTLAHFMLSWNQPSAGPTKHARELWALIRQRPEPLPPLFWFNVLDEQNSKQKFDLSDAGQKEKPLTYHHYNLTAAPSLDFAELTITARTRGRKGLLDCYRINAAGKHETIILLQPSADGEPDQTLTKTLKVPADTGLVQFMVAGGEDFQVGEVTVEAKFVQRAAEQQKPQRESAVSPALRFSERREIVLSINSTKFMLDFDSGLTMDPPQTFRPAQKKMDVHPLEAPPNEAPSGLQGLSLRGVRMKPDGWYVSEAELQQELASDRVGALTKLPYDSDEKATFFFRTADGTDGILQLLAQTDEPKGIRLCYKAFTASKVNAQIKVGMTFDELIALKGRHYRLTYGMREGHLILVYDDIAISIDAPRSAKGGGKVTGFEPGIPREVVQNVPYADEETSPPKGLEFLKPYPKLHGLSLDMTEARFKAVAIAITDFGGERAIPLLVEMVSSSEEARWGLIRLGDLAVPGLVKLIEPGTTADDIVSEQMVRAYLDHRKELPGPIDDRIIAAAQQALAKTTERSQRTQYFKEFLQLAEQRQAATQGAGPQGAIQNSATQAVASSPPKKSPQTERENETTNPPPIALSTTPADDPLGGTTPIAESGYPVIKQISGERSDGWIACEFGLQYRVRAETISLVAGELPLLFVDVRNRGTFKDMGLELHQSRHSVVAGGNRYERRDQPWAGVAPLEPEGKPLTLAFALSDDWKREGETKTPLRLALGKHSITLSVRISPVYPSPDEPQTTPASRKPIFRSLVCRPIEIEIRSGAWSGPPGSLGLENIRREVIAIPDFHSPKVPPNLQRLVHEHQPAAGEFLVKLIKSQDPGIQQAASVVFADAWDSMNREQVESYLLATMTHFVWQRPQYPQGIDAMIGMGPRHRPEYLGRPPDRKYSAETITTLHLDGQQVDQPITYPELGSLSHWIKTKDLSLGRHTLRLATKFTFTRGTETYRGEYDSPEFTFEMVPANTPDDLIAPHDEQLDRLVREALLFADTEFELDHPPGRENIDRIEPAPSESEKWRPQIRWDENKLGLSSMHCPVWKVAKRLPVDLCFSVGFRVANTDTVIPCNDLVALTADGERRNYFSTFGLAAASEFAKHADKEGFVSGRLVLKPSRAAALTDAKVKRYYGGEITSQPVRFKISAVQRLNDPGKDLAHEKERFAFPYFLPGSRIVIGDELADEVNALASKNEQIQFLIKILPPIDQQEKRLSDRQLYAIRLLSLTESDVVIDPLLDRLDFQHKGDGWPAAHALGRLGERSVEPVVKKMESVADNLQKAIMLGSALIEINQKKYPMFLEELRQRKDIKLPDKLLNELLDVYRFAPND